MYNSTKWIKKFGFGVLFLTCAIAEPYSPPTIDGGRLYVAEESSTATWPPSKVKPLLLQTSCPLDPFSIQSPLISWLEASSYNTTCSLQKTRIELSTNAQVHIALVTMIKLSDQHQWLDLLWSATYTVAPCKSSKHHHETALSLTQAFQYRAPHLLSVIPLLYL